MGTNTITQHSKWIGDSVWEDDSEQRLRHSCCHGFGSSEDLRGHLTATHFSVGKGIRKSLCPFQKTRGQKYQEVKAEEMVGRWWWQTGSLNLIKFQHKTKSFYSYDCKNKHTNVYNKAVEILCHPKSNRQGQTSKAGRPECAQHAGSGGACACIAKDAMRQEMTVSAHLRTCTCVSGSDLCVSADDCICIPGATPESGGRDCLKRPEQQGSLTRWKLFSG